MQQYIDGKVLNYIFTVGYRNLKRRMDFINDLNVFPVPDGDTGTNMVHTFGGGLASVTVQKNIGDYMKELSRAVLLSARGNSGVIFSQFFHGLCRGFEEKESISFSDMARAFEYAREDAYKSIMTPTEGTILTVIRESAEFLQENADKYTDFKSGLAALISCMNASLAKTPELLPVLKEAGVVDSGGAGLVCFFEGMHTYFCGTTLEDIEDNDFTPKTVNTSDFGPDSVMEYGYCTEFILQLMNAKTDIASFSTDEFVKPLNALGDSIVAVASDSIVKIHIHTFEPEKVLEYARRFGEFVTLKIENMSVQHSEIQSNTSANARAEEKEKVKYAIVAVASGEGIVDYFYNIGANAVIDGGQTNNPSVSDFLAAFDRFEAEHIVVLPNNSNIILTANQAAEIYKEASVHVIPTKSITEGYSALSMMNLWCDTVDELIEDMSSGLSNVTSAYVTTATRTTNMNGVDIEKDNYIGLRGKEILLCNSDRFYTVTNLIKAIMEEDEKAVAIFFCGKSVSDEETDALRAFMENEYPLVDFGFVDGKQDVYDYIISLE